MSQQRDTSTPAVREKRLIGGLSHDLRSPLNSIIGFAELLQSQLADSLGEKHRRFLNNISSSAHDLLSLIDLVVDVALLDDGEQASQREAVALSEITGRCVQLTLERAQRRGVTVRPAPADARDHFLRSNPVLLLWALIQIVDHAVDGVGSEGEVQLEHSAHPDDKTFVVRIIAAVKEAGTKSGERQEVNPHDNRIEEAVGLLRQLEGHLEYDGGSGRENLVYTVTLPMHKDTPEEEHRT